MRRMEREGDERKELTLLDLNGSAIHWSEGLRKIHSEERGIEERKR